MKNNKSVSAAIGEYFVLGELLKRGSEAYLAHGQTQKGWDIAIFTGKEIKRVQVKTIGWPKQQAVNDVFSTFDFLVVVLLNRENERSRFLVFNQEDLESLLSKKNEDRLDKNRTLSISKKFLKQNKIFEDAWKKICG